MKDFLLDKHDAHEHVRVQDPDKILTRASFIESLNMPLTKIKTLVIQPSDWTTAWRSSDALFKYHCIVNAIAQKLNVFERVILIPPCLPLSPAPRSSPWGVDFATMWADAKELARSVLSMEKLETVELYHPKGVYVEVNVEELGDRNHEFAVAKELYEAYKYSRGLNGGRAGSLKYI